ncbi:MAG: hypothetical protein WAT39_24040 [Planctomycetota bacterium]
MAVDVRELAHFGGWVRRAVGGGDLAWTDPSERVQEVVPSIASGLILPPNSLVPAGVPYWVVNSGSASLTVKRPSDLATIDTVAANSAFVFVRGNGSAWTSRGIGTPQFGGVVTQVVYGIDVYTNTPDLNVLRRIVEQYGYNGVNPVVVTVRIRPGAVVGCTGTTRSLVTGTTWNGVSWAAGSNWLLVVDANAYVTGPGGAAGRGGVPLTGAAAGFAGSAGGQAIRTTIPMRIICAGRIAGGGGGGGGGGSSLTVSLIHGGGGGGGAGGTMASNGTLIGAARGGATMPAHPGYVGGHEVGGNGGGGFFFGGNGGRGGGLAQVGTNGGNGPTTGGTGGAAGAAISYLAAAGSPTIIQGAGSIVGSIISEAS